MGLLRDVGEDFGTAGGVHGNERLILKQDGAVTGLGKTSEQAAECAFATAAGAGDYGYLGGGDGEG